MLLKKIRASCDKCGGEIYQRKDDSEEVICTPLETYDQNTEPFKEYYQKKNLFVEIDGLGHPEEVFKRFQPHL